MVRHSEHTPDDHAPDILERALKFATNHARRRIKCRELRGGISAKVLWSVCGIILGKKRDRKRHVLETYVAEGITAHLATLSPEERKRAIRIGLPLLVDDIVFQLARQTEMAVRRGRPVKASLGRNRIALHVGIPDKKQPNCFLVCEDGPRGRRILAAQTPGQWKRRQERRFHRTYR